MFTFEEYQENTHKTAVFDEHIRLGMTNEDRVESLRLAYLSLGLAGEAAEVANKAKKVIRGDYPIDEIADAIAKELGDVEWYISEICTLLGVSLADVARGNNKKLLDRAERGMIKGDGDER